MKKHISLFLTTVVFSLSISAQHVEDHSYLDSNSVHHKEISHGIAILYGSILLPEYDYYGQEVGKALLPSLSLDYEIWWKNKVGILVMNEFVLNSYEVRGNDGEFFQRESILITAIGFGYSPFKNANVFAGAGCEMDLANGNSFNVFKVGSEYMIPIRNNWASVFAIAADFRKDYSSISFEIGFARHF